MRILAGLFCGLLAVALAGCPCLPREEFRLEAVAGGYVVEGPYGFAGTLARPASAGEAWRFAGTFAFPTPGYTVLREIEIAESFPEQVHIRFSVLKPGPGFWPQVIEFVDVDEAIAVSPEATFRVSLESRCLPGGAP